MTTTRLDDGGASAVLEEHRSIHAAVEALQVQVRAPAPSARAPWLKRLAKQLDALAGLLRPHFLREETGGMFETIETVEPGSAHECARLRGEHDALLERLSTLERTLREPRPDTKSVEGLRRGIRALLADLARHEAAENALLVRVMEGEEVGAVD